MAGCNVDIAACAGFMRVCCVYSFIAANIENITSDLKAACMILHGPPGIEKLIHPEYDPVACVQVHLANAAYVDQPGAISLIVIQCASLW